MRYRNNQLFFFFIVSLFLFVIAGCSSESGANEVSIEDLPNEGDFSEELTLNLSGSFNQGKIEDNNWVQKKLEDMFNVKIKNAKINTWNADEVSLAIASGEVPDTFSFTAGTMSPIEYYENGVSRTIPKDMIKKYAPRYSKMLDENPPGWDMNLAPDNEDEYLTLTGLQAHTEKLTWTPTFRLDWLENLGIDPPGEIKPVGTEDGRERIFYTDEAYSLEEVEEILHAFTFEDPDGNGKDDTYGILPNNKSSEWMETIFGAFGFSLGYNLMENDELVAAEISDSYKEALKQLAKWSDQGLIDPEWTTLDSEKSWEKYKQGKTGYYTAQSAYLGMDDWASGRAPQNIIEKDPEAKLLATAPEVGPNGQQGASAFLPVTPLGDAFYISKDVTDEELARILQIFDYINFDNDARWTLYGEIGTHSEWEGTPEESAIKVNPEYRAEEGEMGFWAYNFRTYDRERVQWFTSEYSMNLEKDFFARPEVIEDMLIRPYRYDLFDETKIKELEKRYSGQLDTVVEEFRMRAIVGEIDVDEAWDGYVENWLNNGGQEILTEMEKAPKVSDLLSE